MEQHIARAEIVWPGPTLLQTYVELRGACHRAGHALGQSEHDADRWIAATALHLGIPLVSHERIFERTPGLTFETQHG
jgi:predicted nucleic acid-binding protein